MKSLPNSPACCQGRNVKIFETRFHSLRTPASRRCACARNTEVHGSRAVASHSKKQRFLRVRCFGALQCRPKAVSASGRKAKSEGLRQALRLPWRQPQGKPLARRRKIAQAICLASSFRVLKTLHSRQLTMFAAVHRALNSPKSGIPLLIHSK